MDPNDCDTANARLIMRLESEDIEDALQNSTDPIEIEWLNTRATILRMQLQETRGFDLAQADQRMQHSVTQAMLSDFPEAEAVLQEETVLSDTAARRRQAGATAQPALRVEGRDGYYEDNRIDPSGSTTLTTYLGALKLDENNEPRECYICMVEVHYSLSTLVGACNHVWCRDCLTQMFDLATKNESNYPVRCCCDVPVMALDHPGIVSLVGTEAIAAVKAKIVEYETENKTYCHDRLCSAFIPPDSIEENQATCPSCEKITCAGCKAESHGKDDCKTEQDEAFELWQQANHCATCRTCRRVIIISHGCNHMRCFCGAEFCYECGETWKTCRCARWHEERLIERAVVFAERQGPDADLAEVMEDLRNEVDCRHTNWTRVEVSGDRAICADCRWRADEFLNQCDGCDVRVCNRCRSDY